MIMVPTSNLYFRALSLPPLLVRASDPRTNEHYFSLAFPLLSAPLWAFGDAELVYKLIQALNALIASLAAVPVFLLARELRLRATARLGVTALALALPGLALASYISTDVLGFTLCLCACSLRWRALDQPTPRQARAGSSLRSAR